MDPRKGPRQYFRGYKSSGVQQYGRNNCEMNSKYGLYKPSRPQRNPYKIKSNFTYIRNFQPNYSQNVNSRRQPLMKSKPVREEMEDQEEEERKRKLNDTAIKLLNKIKTWNAESTLNQDSKKSGNDLSQTSVNCDLNRNSIEQLTGECSRNSEVNSEGKTKRIAHSKAKNNTINMKKPMPKLSQSSKHSVRTRRYDVNKATVKDFQNRIQHKLINDIMQMPKESLQNVLNDPKINPIMELKMSHLVRENKLLIAQKLRALAESKMTSSDSSTNSLLLVDIDKLIDPVIETDLSVLPYELIKQMENIFQVEFDYTNLRNSCEQEPQNIESESPKSNAPSNSASSDNTCQMSSENSNMLEDCKTNLIPADEVSLESILNLTNEDMGLRTMTETSPLLSSTSSIEDNQKTENLRNQFINEDFGVYECSTDEDEDADIKDISFPTLKRYNQENSSHGCCYNTSKPVTDEEIPVRNKSKRKSTLDPESVSKKKKKNKEVKNNQRTVIVDRLTENNTDLVVSNSKPNKNAVGSQNANESSSQDGKQNSSVFSPQSECLSIGCQTSCEVKNVEVQTSNDLCESSSLYGVPLPKFVSSGDSHALLEEVTLIQNLVSKLNERRFIIFLQLAKSNPSGSFISDKITTDSFAETLSNGSIDLVDSLKKFFTKTQKKSKNHIRTIKDHVNKPKPWKKKKNRNEKGNGDQQEMV